jgi:hypothetical protein
MIGLDFIKNLPVGVTEGGLLRLRRRTVHLNLSVALTLVVLLTSFLAFTVGPLTTFLAHLFTALVCFLTFALVAFCSLLIRFHAAPLWSDFHVSFPSYRNSKMLTPREAPSKICQPPRP